MARKSKNIEEYDELDEAEDEYDDYEDDYDDDYDDDYYEPRKKNPLKAFVIALLVLLVLMAAIIGLLYARLRSANDQVKELNASLEASRTEINNLLNERTSTPAPEATPVPTPAPTPEPPATVTEPEATPDPAAQPGEGTQEGTGQEAQPTADPGTQTAADPAAQPTEDPGTQPTPDPAAQPGEGTQTGTETTGLLKDTVTDEILAGVARPNDESWFTAPKNGVVNAFMLATHWGPGMNWYDNGALKEGTKVEILADQSGWLLLRTAEGVYGWAVSGFVTVSE